MSAHSFEKFMIVKPWIPEPPFEIEISLMTTSWQLSAPSSKEAM